MKTQTFCSNCDECIPENESIFAFDDDNECCENCYYALVARGEYMVETWDDDMYFKNHPYVESI